MQCSASCASCFLPWVLVCTIPFPCLLLGCRIWLPGNVLGTHLPSDRVPEMSPCHLPPAKLAEVVIPSAVHGCWSPGRASLGTQFTEHRGQGQQDHDPPVQGGSPFPPVLRVPRAIGRRVFLPAFVSPIVCTDCFEYEIKPLCSTVRSSPVRWGSRVGGAGPAEPACSGPPVPLVPAVTCRAVAGPPGPSLRTSLRRAERRERPRSQHEHPQGLQHLGDRIPGGERRRGGSGPRRGRAGCPGAPLP